MRRLLLTLLAITTIGFFAACSDDDDDNNEPAATNNNNNSGANSISATLDGNQTTFSPYTYTSNDTIAFGGFEGSTYPQLTFMLTDTVKAKTYDLSYTVGMAPNVPNVFYYETEQEFLVLEQGTMNISIMDTSNNKVVGTFAGLLINFSTPPDTIVVTNGAFNINY